MAVARSLDSARARAESRLQRFLDAALELMKEGEPGKDFTVQEVVERSGQSLRLFYQYFGGKHELLLALFEESVRSTTEFLRERIADEEDALAAAPSLRGGVPPSLSATPERREPGTDPERVDDGGLRATAAHQPSTEAALAFAPLVTLFSEVFDDAAATGSLRPGLRRSTIAGMVLEAVMFNTFSATIAGTSIRPEGADPAEELWDLILHGVGAEDAG